MSIEVTVGAKGILVLPHLRVQNANAISSPMTHGFPAVSAFTGLMWALERTLSEQHDWPLHFKKVGVICHSHEEQVNGTFLKTFNLTRNPLTKDGSTAAIVEEGRMHMEITLIFEVQEKFSETSDTNRILIQGNEDVQQQFAKKAMDAVTAMRIAGGSVLPSMPAFGKRTKPWLAVLAEDPAARTEQFRRWCTQWLPGFALVGRDDLLADRLQNLQEKHANATVLDAWLHASRFNWEPIPQKPDGTSYNDGEVPWHDPYRPKGSGWVVPIPVGYAGLGQLNPAGEVTNTRDATTSFRFVEAIYGLGEWISPHRLDDINQLWWQAEFDEESSVYRCRNQYRRLVEEDDFEEIFEDLDDE